MGAAFSARHARLPPARRQGCVVRSRPMRRSRHDRAPVTFGDAAAVPASELATAAASTLCPRAICHGITPVQASAVSHGIAREGGRARAFSAPASTAIEFLPLHQSAGQPAVKVSSAAMHVHKLALDLLARANEVALGIPPASPERLRRVQLALDPDRAIAILKKNLASVPPASSVVLWVEHCEKGDGPTPNHLSRPARETADFRRPSTKSLRGA